MAVSPLPLWRACSSQVMPNNLLATIKEKLSKSVSYTFAITLMQGSWLSGNGKIISSRYVNKNLNPALVEVPHAL